MRDLIKDRNQSYLLALAGIVLIVLFVDAPTIRITFIGDDALRASIDGWLAVHHSGLLAAFQSERLREDLYNGRFHPLFVALTLIEMHLVHQPLPLKLVQLFAVGLNVATLAFVVREILGSASRALLAALFVVSRRLYPFDRSSRRNGAAVQSISRVRTKTAPFGPEAEIDRFLSLRLEPGERGYGS
ncbi:MAG TPA: hypothetical protein VNG31_03485 [Candidatus Baltobacteraceae bacterium]|nr:hypothetical protein [Candidatus Baltobacteraceae bacterium]